jgi:hypothetical protein
VFAYLHGSFVARCRFTTSMSRSISATDRRRTRSESSNWPTPRLATRIPVDIRALNDAPLSFAFRAMQGERCEPRRRRPGRCLERTGRRYLDIAPILRRDARCIRTVMLDADVVRSRCLEIEDSVTRLERLAVLPRDRFLADRDSQTLRVIACSLR